MDVGVPLTPLSIAAWAALAVVSSAIAYLLFFRILASAGATNVALVTLLIPAGAVPLGALALGETVTLENVAGMALVFAGLIAIDGCLATAVKRLATSPEANDPSNLE